METQKTPYWETHANWDTAGNCTFCGEAGRCKCSHPPLPQPQHTPTPLIDIYDGAADPVSEEFLIARLVSSLGISVKKAAFIILAVNAYEKDQEIKKDLVTALSRLMGNILPPAKNSPTGPGSITDNWNFARKAIAKAKVK